MNYKKHNYGQYTHDFYSKICDLTLYTWVYSTYIQVS